MTKTEELVKAFDDAWARHVAGFSSDRVHDAGLALAAHATDLAARLDAVTAELGAVREAVVEERAAEEAHRAATDAWRGAERGERGALWDAIMAAAARASVARSALSRLLTTPSPAVEEREGRLRREALAEVYDSRAEWSRRTFGEKAGYQGVVEHIRRELLEIEAEPTKLEEWVDVVMLAMDGAWRSAGADGAAFWEAFAAKARKNEARRWKAPDAQGVIEHDAAIEAGGER